MKKLSIAISLGIGLIFSMALNDSAFALTSIKLSVADIRNNSPYPSTTFTLSWAPATDANKCYLAEWQPNGKMTYIARGTAKPPVTLTRTVLGTWKYQVIFGYEATPGVITKTGQSNQVSVLVTTPKTPTLLSPARPPVNLGFRIQWTNDPGNYTYELQESKTTNFATVVTYWQQTNEAAIPAKAPGTYYYRVRGWNKAKASGGTSSAWSSVITVKVLTDSEFLDYVERKTFDYFLASTFSNGLALDRKGIQAGPNNVVSTAACGFYLSALTIGAERGWISWTEAYNRALATLRTFDSGTPKVHGFFYHYLNPDGTRLTKPFVSEVSTMDTAILVAGALQAGEYFSSEAKTIADRIYRRVEWSWAFDSSRKLMKMAWSPENGFQGSYDIYSESLVLYLLAIGAPGYAIPADSFYGFARPKGKYKGADFIFTWGGEIFIYQFTNAWFDFSGKRDSLGVNWWENGIEGVKANQKFAIDNASLGYSQYLWGITACDGPGGYKPYGAKPSYSNIHDGTIGMSGVGGSIALAPSIALPSLKQIYALYGDKVWTTCGFADSYNPKQGWVASDYIGIDQGIILVMLENYKSRLVWRTFMQNEHVKRALERTRFSGFYTPAPDVSVENFEDNNLWTPETTVGWWSPQNRTVYDWASAPYTQYPVSEGRYSLSLRYNKTGYPYSYLGARMLSGNPKSDFSKHELLTLKVYGACDLLVKLRDRNNAEQSVAMLKALNPSGWNTLTFDYSQVGIAKNAVSNILFCANPGNSSSSGTIYLDDIRLESRKTALLEDFEDSSFFTPDTTLGWWDIDGTTVYRRSQSKDPSHGGMGAMRVEYTKNGLAWSCFGGHLSPVNPNKDFTKHARIAIWVYGQAEIMVKLRDRAQREAEIGRSRATNPGGWTRLVFDYSCASASINLSDIDNVLFFVDPGNAFSSGTICLDDIVLE